MPHPPPQFINLHLHFNISIQAKNARIPVNSSAGLHTRRPTRKWILYLSILMLHLWQMAKTYMSNQLLVCMCMDAPFPPDDLFIFMLSFRLTTKAYFSIQLFVFMAIAASVQQPTCLFWYFDSYYHVRSSGPLRYCSTYIHRSTRPGIYTYPLQSSLPANTHNYLSTNLKSNDLWTHKCTRK